MNSKNNRVNHDFQIAHFIAGSCHTPDAAWSLLCDQREERRNALALARVSAMRSEAKLLRARRNLHVDDEAVALEAQADLAEAEALAATGARNLAGCVAELATLENYIAQLEPQRKFRHLPDVEAHEAAQYEEWKLELMHRAENQVIAHGRVDAEQLSTMRLHPAFKTEMLPALNALIHSARQGGALAIPERPRMLAIE